jgi:hypothetical protein
MDKKKLTELVLPGYEQKPLAVLFLLFVWSAFETFSIQIL